MNENTVRPETVRRETVGSETDAYAPPTVEVICLACEISSYAPDEGGAPLF